MKQVICRDINNNKTEPIPVEKLIFRPSIYGVIIQEGKVLLVPQWEDGYDFPGGGIDKGETLEGALLREVKEETGLVVKKDKIIACEQDFFKAHNHDDVYFHSILMYFVCTNPQGEISTDGFDEEEKEYAKKAEWVDLEKIKSLKFYNSVDSVAIIEQAIEPNRF